MRKLKARWEGSDMTKQVSVSIATPMCRFNKTEAIAQRDNTDSLLLLSFAYL